MHNIVYMFFMFNSHLLNYSYFYSFKMNSSPLQNEHFRDVVKALVVILEAQVYLDQLELQALRVSRVHLEILDLDSQVYPFQNSVLLFVVFSSLLLIN